MDPRIDELIAAWFEGDVPARWFRRDPAFDDELRRRFGALQAEAAGGALDGWADTARGALALVILLDQLPRNLYRDDARAFAQDAHALRVVRDAIAAGRDRELGWLERYVLLMPFMHAETREAQRESLVRFGALLAEAAAGDAPEAVRGTLAAALDWAERHAVIVERFGRYPHRNELLGRASTDEERVFLAGPGSRF